MQCSSCGVPNEPEAKFCEECGTQLAKVCPQCGREVRPTAKFCRDCGVPLTEQAAILPAQAVASPLRSYPPPHLAERIRAAQAALEARGATDGERKTITALFADIKGSMALIEDLDPEEARALVDPALAMMMAAVHRYEGYVVQSTGDGIFAFFGAPLAHEDHPQRALYAALLMQEESKRFAETLRREKGITFQIRIGLNTGEMVLRSIRKDDLRTEYTPIGHSTSLAARMESLAAPGSIVVSEHTYKLTEGYFEFKALGEARIKGVSEPVRIYEVLGIGPLRTRLQVATRRGLVRFVGRQSEMEHLRRAFAQAQAGHGQIVGVMGEPGVGKSRLFHEFKFVAQSGCLVLETFSVSHSKAYPYLPLIDLLVRESLNQPLVLICEDLHWLDNETQAFLSLLSESLASARMLLLVNYRPEYRHEWGNKTFYTQLRLDPLGQEDAQELLAALLGNDPSLQSLKRIILEKTEGNPFFMEEIVQELREQKALAPVAVGGATGQSLLPTELRLPPTVQGVLASRIDRLPAPEKTLLQTLSVLGKEFSFSLLQQVVNQSEAILHPLLSHLQEAEFIYEQPAFPEPEYTFKHALTQDVAYTSLLIERRKVLHEQTGQAMEALFHSQLEDHYGDLAHHYSRSGNAQKALEYLQLAGQQAVQRSAYAEALSHLFTALDLLQTLPDTLERTQQELTLQIALGAPLQATKGPGAPEVERAYSRARELCGQVGETPQLFPVLRGLWNVYTTQAEVRTGRELAEQLLSFAQRTQDPAL
ncbi:MAG: AAA family ATPase, partial [Deltaproteobacteria bacterium]|nr:AAA family ATPase [Deltaproteobacteria bacterium]